MKNLNFLLSKIINLIHQDTDKKLKMKIRKLNKKGAGFLESEVLKIVLAVLCIVLLLYLGFKLYSLFLKKTDTEQARETLEQILQRASSLKEGENAKYLVVAPAGWYLIYYDSNFPGMPSDCGFKGCICICSFKKSLAGKVFVYTGDGPGNCEEQRVCRNPDFKIKIEYLYYFNNKNVGNGRIGIENVNWISFSVLPLDIFITKKNNEAIISGNMLQTSISDKLLNLKIKVDGNDVSFGDFLKTRIFNNCNFNEDGKRKINSEDEELAKKTILDFLNSIAQNYSYKSFNVYIFSAKDEIVDWQTGIYISNKDTSEDVFYTKEYKEICKGDFAGYVQIGVQ